MEQVFRRGLAMFRWGAWIWMTATLVIYWQTDYLRHKHLAVGLILLALVVTLLQTALVPSWRTLASRKRVAAAEMVLGLAIMVLDGYVRRPGVVFETGPTLGSYWPVVGLMGAATYLPLKGAVLAGLSFGVARAVSTLLNGEALAQLTGSELLTIINAGVFAALAAASVFGLMKLLRDAESEVALVRAREEVARTLHDGVLQTLAVVERRTDDDQLARLARQQEQELRSYLLGQRSEGSGLELGSALLHAAKRFEAAFDGRVEVVLAPLLPEIDEGRRNALLGAVGEALTNAGKHGGASHVNIYVEPDGENGIFCSVKDDGTGFDPSSATPGIGLTRSIRGRIEEAGGRMELKSRPGSGTEVLLWLP